MAFDLGFYWLFAAPTLAFLGFFRAPAAGASRPPAPRANISTKATLEHLANKVKSKIRHRKREGAARPIFGKVTGLEMHLSPVGETVARVWGRIPDFYANVVLENFVVMPNHVHGIIVVGEAGLAPEMPRPRKHALSEIVRGFKSMSAREINRDIRDGVAVWQRGYYEHIVRDDADLARIREYVDNNPIAWANDPENPDRIS